MNIVAGSAALLMPELNVSLLFGSHIVLQGHLMRFHLMLWSFVLAMGLGYWLAAQSPEDQTGILLTGGIGKLIFVGLCIETLWSGYGTALLLGPIIFDTVIGAALLIYVAPRLRAA